MLKKKPRKKKLIVDGSFSSNVVLDTRCRAITDKYEILKTLGEGKMGKVVSARKIKPTYDRRDNPPPRKIIALKSAIVQKSNFRAVEALRREIDILKDLDHPNIVKAYEVYQTSDRNIHLSFQFCSGGNLYSRFPKNSEGRKIPFSEKDAAAIIYQLLSALAHMHASGICHRDVKFENIMFDNPESKIINLIDFGAGCSFKPGEKMHYHIGTTYTMASEVFKGNYTEKADLWSVGVITYMMLSLTKPFYGESKNVIEKKIMIGDFKYYSPNWVDVSSSAKLFINALLTKDPSKRPSAAEALQHMWLNEVCPSSEHHVGKETLKAVHDSITAYGKYNDLKRIGLNIIAHQIETDHVQEIKNIFNNYDENKDGTITFPNFLSMMQAINPDYSIEEVRVFFTNSTMGDQSKTLRYTEFLATTLGIQKGDVTEDRLWRAFDRLDHEARGKITRDNLARLLGNDYSKMRMDSLWDDHDFGVGVPFEIFLSMFDDLISKE